MSTITVGTRVRWPSENWEGQVIEVNQAGVRIRWDTKPNDQEPTTGTISKAGFKREMVKL